jgi:pimeloyl-ACP methyl ester carboxylesterase
MKLFKRIPAVVLCLAVMFVFTLVAWYMSSEGGAVKIRRINIAANDGTIASAIVYIPPNATDATPAPFVLNFAGRSTNAQYLATYAIEQARRGFVAINCDVWGNGQTEFYNPPEGGWNLAQAVTYIDYARTLTFIDPDQMNIVGYSLGAMNATGLAEPYIDSVNCVGLIYMPGSDIAAAAPELDTNWLVVRAAGDEGNTNNELYEENLTKNFELPSPVERNTLYGSYADKTAREYVYVLSSIHQTATINTPTVAAISRALLASNNNVISIDPNNMVWGWHQIFVGLAGCMYIVTVCAFGWTLMKKIPYFNSLMQPVPGKAASPGRGTLAFQYLWAIVVPMLLFIPVGDWVMFDSFLTNNPLFRSNNLNGNFFPLVVFSILSIALILYLRGRRKKQGHDVGLAAYGLAPQGPKVMPWGLIGKSILLGIIVGVISLGWMFFVEGVFGINYQIWQAIIYNRTSAERFIMSFWYMPFFIITLGVPAITMNTARRLKDTGNPTRDLARDIAINFAIGFLPIFLMLCIQYIPSVITQSGYTTWNRGTYALQFLWNTAENGRRGSVAALDYAWNVPFVTGAGAAMSTFFYRKTGTVWPGVLVGTVFTSIVVCANYTLQA